MKKFIDYPLKFDNLKLINTKKKDFEDYAVNKLIILRYYLLFIILLFLLLYYFHFYI